MKQAQQMQQKVKAVQQQIAEMEVRGEAGGGMVSLRMNGRHDVKAVSIDASLLAEDKEMLEDLLAAAVNDAVRKVEQGREQKMSSVSAGLNLPEDFSLPF